MPGPYDSGNGNRGGRSSLGPNGIHYTDYRDGGHNSWDENHGDVSRIHSTDHSNDKKTNYPADKRGNPFDH